MSLINNYVDVVDVEVDLYANYPAETKRFQNVLHKMGVFTLAWSGESTQGWSVDSMTVDLYDI